MANPITWRTVDAPNFSDASRGMYMAQQSIGSAFDKLSGLLEKREKVDDQNWQTQKTNNTNEFLNRAAAEYGSPEAFQAAMKSGELFQRLQGYGSQVDQAQARQFLDNRLGILQDRALKANQYADQERDRRTLDARQAALAFAARGDELGFNIAMNNPELAYVAGDMAKAMTAGKAALDKAALEAEVARSGITHQRALEQTSARQAAAAEAQVGLARLREQNDSRRIALAEGKDKREADKASRLLMLSSTPYAQGHLDTAEGQNNLRESILKLPGMTPDAGEALYSAMLKQATKGVYIKEDGGKTIRAPLAVADALAAIGSTKSRWYQTNGFRADEAISLLQQRIQDNAHQRSMLDGMRAGMIDPILISDEARQIPDPLTGNPIWVDGNGQQMSRTARLLAEGKNPGVSTPNGSAPIPAVLRGNSDSPTITQGSAGFRQFAKALNLPVTESGMIDLEKADPRAIETLRMMYPRDFADMRK